MVGRYTFLGMLILLSESLFVHSIIKKDLKSKADKACQTVKIHRNDWKDFDEVNLSATQEELVQQKYVLKKSIIQNYKDQAWSSGSLSALLTGAALIIPAEERFKKPIFYSFVTGLIAGGRATYSSIKAFNLQKEFEDEVGE